MERIANDLLQDIADGEEDEPNPDGAYVHYHDLEGHLFTFLRDWQSTGETAFTDPPVRYRIRRCPGFQLLAEKREGLCEQGKVYDLKIRKQGGRLACPCGDRSRATGRRLLWFPHLLHRTLVVRSGSLVAVNGTISLGD